MFALAERIRRQVAVAREQARRRAIFLPELQALHDIAELILDGQRQMIIYQNLAAAHAAFGAATDAISRLMEAPQSASS